MKRLILIILVIISTLLVYNKVKASEIIIPDNAIRLRVIPNSNSSLDIVMKEKVKDYLEENIYNLFIDVKDKSSAKDIINNNIDSINTDIDNIFKENNYNMNFNVNYGYNYFPKKTYKGVTYKEGEYESLVVTIGEGSGDNFWCVLFPSFCSLDTQDKSDAEYKFYVKELIDKYLG